MNSRSLWFIFSGLLISASAFADHQTDTVQAWLERMHNAAHLKNYDGIFVFSRNNSMNAMRIIHSSDGSNVRERIVSLDGNGREVIRKGNLVTCILPDRKSVVVEKSVSTANFPPSFPVDIQRLVPYYEFAVKEDCREKVAGRKSTKIDIIPRDQYRYGYRLWVDRETGLLLKTVLLNEHERPVEQFMFTRLEYLDSVPEKLLEPENSGKEFQWKEPETDVIPEKNEVSRKWHFTKMPPGFSVNAKMAHNSAGSKSQMEQLVLSDGLASISVFIESYHSDDESLQGGSRMGAVNAYGKVLGQHHVTAVGEVPQSAVRLVSESLVSQ